MRIVFRVDASLEIGSGHVTRCLTLAQALRDGGCQVMFVCRDCPGNMCNLIAGHAFSLVRLPMVPTANAAQIPTATPDEPVRVANIGAPADVDAQATREAIAAWGGADWLVVDQYSLDHLWERSLRLAVPRIMVIDDLADRPHDCDLLLNQNIAPEAHRRHAAIAEASTLLLGPKYALLQPDYETLHALTPLREGRIRRILIYFGAADRDNLTSRALAAFLGLERHDVEVDVVVHEGSPHLQGIKRQITGHSNITLHAPLPTLARLMARADIAIGACGTTAWERLCVGLPALVITLAENQRSISRELHARGLIRELGDVTTVRNADIARVLDELLRVGVDKEWSARCHATVDGKGARRVRAVMTTTAQTPLVMRDATGHDESLLLEWANDPITRRNSFTSDPIDEISHRRWFQPRLDSPESCRIYIGEVANDIPVGQVRFERVGHEWQIAYSLAREFRRRGLGAPLLDSALQSFRELNRGAIVFGNVKPGNLSSRQVFETLGFQRIPIAGFDQFRRVA